MVLLVTTIVKIGIVSDGEDKSDDERIDERQLVVYFSADSRFGYAKDLFSGIREAVADPELELWLKGFAFSHARQRLNAALQTIGLDLSKALLEGPGNVPGGGVGSEVAANKKREGKVAASRVRTERRASYFVDETGSE